MVQVSGQAVSRGPSCERLHVFRNYPHGPVQKGWADHGLCYEIRFTQSKHPLQVHSLGVLP